MAQDKGLFMDDYFFMGKHEEEVRKLISEVDNKSGAHIFTSGIELFMAAAIIGCSYNRRATKEKGPQTFRIFQNQFSNHYQRLLFIYKLVMLCDSDVTLSGIDKVNNAFRHPEDKRNRDVFEEYMLGGIDVIYDKLFVSTNTSYDNFKDSLCELISEFKNDTKKDVGIVFNEGENIW